MEIGRSVIVFLQDAILPPDPRWAFMEAQRWRVSMARFKGAPSECLIIPGEEAETTDIGTDLTDRLGVMKYEKPIPPNMSGECVGTFPYFIPKTDETNFQASEHVDKLAQDQFYITEKADGTSCTAWVDEAGELHVCNRSLELREFTASGASNVYWRVARKYRMETLPRGHAVQFELVGPGIQKNRMGLTELEGRLFRVWDYGKGQYWDYARMKQLAQQLGMPLARCIGVYAPLDEPLDFEQLRKLAEIQYGNGKTGEGIVIQDMANSWSFKVINLLYKD
ncbi:hypothetical protein A6M27_12590 [Acidithiobacillus thiooxidans]|nr:hypothetical protein A6O26_06895 [Acidithiobacillus thiooxidans]OCX86489.1 hypothetical protein A6M27_12590 [Acidithiobacillus thiooxidans]OFC48722.1 hypothetical protein BAE47_06785 [Acidithiobacillus thiooxidans]